jgi:hypothetical protein
MSQPWWNARGTCCAPSSAAAVNGRAAVNGQSARIDGALYDRAAEQRAERATEWSSSKPG